MSIIGYGTTIGYSLTNGSFTAVAQVTEISPPETTVGEAKVTHLLSPNAFHEYIASLGEGGEGSFKFLFAKTLAATLRTMQAGRLTYYWQVTFPDGTSQGSTLVFQGHIKGLGTMVPMEEKVECEIKIKVTGLPVFTAGT